MVNECLELMGHQTLMQQVFDLMEFQGFEVEVVPMQDSFKRWKCLEITKPDGEKRTLVFNHTGTEMWSGRL